MCGIAGFIHKNIQKAISKSKITKMIGIIQHRGPDATRVIIGKNFSFATARLSIEKLDEGYQPIIYNNKRYVISFNGEIFNYKNIIAKYSFSGKKIDSEVKLLAELFNLKGINFIKEIKGQFAISIYDVFKNTLYLFRDRFGIRPLFFKHQKDTFLYASEIKSIMTFDESPADTSLAGIASTSLFWANIGQQTSFKNIFQIPPGSYLVYSNDKIEIKKYWENPICLTNKNDKIDKPFKSEKFYELIKNAINSQNFGEVGFSSYLSGGIDSSVLAYMLTKIQNSPIDTFSVQFENKEYDESQAQKKIQNIIKSNHFSLKISNQDIADNFEKAVYHAECHLFRTAPVPMYLLAKHVRSQGHKVVFTGEGADEILLGYDLFGETKIRKFWSKLPNSNLRPELLKKLYYYLPQFTNPRYFNITKEFYKKNLHFSNQNFYSHQTRWEQYFTIKSFFNIDEDKYDKKMLERNLLDLMPKEFKDLTIIRKAQTIEIATLLSGYLLSSQGDRMSMAHSVEGRYPYLDDDFTEELAKISSELKAPGLKLKNILRQTFKKYLPKDVVERPKFAYQAPEAKVFFENKKGLKIVEEFIELLPSYKNLKSDAFLNLISKLKDTNLNLRLSFRENMAFIIGLSEHFLVKSAKSWSQFIPNKDKKIEYVYYK